MVPSRTLRRPGLGTICRRSGISPSISLSEEDVTRKIAGIASIATVVASFGFAATAVSGAAHATPASPQPPAVGDAQPSKPDNLFDPLASQRAEQKDQAVGQLLSGEATTTGKGPDRTITMADGTEVDYPASQTAQLLTFLVDFGTGTANAAFPDNKAGPLNNQIAEPGPSDNSTYWVSDFSSQHYKDMFFNGLPDQGGESFKDVYKEMSSGRFDLEGDVSDWVTLPNRESYYQSATGDEDQVSMTRYIGDSATAWYNAQVAAGKSPADIKAYLAKFDVWDRYDYDLDGNFNEPDGYIDHFQAIHAGEGEEAGAPAWTIWSHRWAAGQSLRVGPAGNQAGGVQIGTTGLWIRDYTTEPENGGLGVFAHEFGHDLGLPDYYDTQGGDNGTSFWTLMSQGSWNGHGADAIGTTPNHMDAPSKMFLGWIKDNDLKVVDGTGAAQDVNLGPSEHASNLGAQALAVTLPPGTTQVDAMEPDTGSHHDLYSGDQDNRVVTATSPDIPVPAGTPSLNARVSYDLEKDYDYAYVKVSNDGGTTWTNLHTSKSDVPDPAIPDDPSSPEPEGITDCSGTGTGSVDCEPAWTDLTADLTPYAGTTVKLRFSVVTDGNTHGVGLSVDSVKVGSTLVADFEAGATGWVLDGFNLTHDGTYDAQYERYYVAENKQYLGYDATLKTGPYNFDYAKSAPNKVDHFAYQDGLLVWYHNGLYGDNNTIDHPGGGQALPVDANATFGYWTLGGRPAPRSAKYASSKLQAFDATFDVDQTDGLLLTREDPTDGTPVTYNVPAHQSVPVFDDSDVNAYYDATDAKTKQYSTQVAGVGTMIQVVSSNEANGQMRLKVGKRFVAPTSAPAITGNATVGSTLTAVAPAYAQPGVTSTYQWKVGGVAVPGATASTYQVKPGDTGKPISVEVTGVKAGYASSVTAAGPVTGGQVATTLEVDAPAMVKQGHKAKITVTVHASGATPSGSVKVSYAGKELSGQLVDGVVRFKLPKVSKAGHKKLVVAYVPATGFAPASQTLMIRIPHRG
jgi:immune inhibitor A